MNTDHLLTGPELATAAHTTYRKITLWTAADIIEPVQPPRGAGYRTGYHPNLIPVVTTLHQMTEAFDRMLTHRILRQIADHHADGILTLENGIVILWPLPHVPWTTP